MYEDFWEADLPAGVAVGTSDVISNEKIGPTASGFWSRKIITETVLWLDASTGAATVWADNLLVADINQDGLSRTQRRSVDGVAVASLETVRSGISAESGYALAGTTAGETGNGAGRVASDQVKENAIADAEVVIRYDPGKRTDTARRIVKWLNVTSANAALIVADATTNEDDLSGATYEAEAASYALDYVDKMPHSGDPLFDVIRVAYKAASSGGVPIAWGARTNVYSYQLERLHDSTVADVGYEYIRWRWWRYKYDIGYHTNGSNAWTTIDGGQQGSRVWQASGLIWGSKKVKEVKHTIWYTGAVKADPSAYADGDWKSV